MKLRLATAAMAVLFLLAAGATYAYFFSGLRSAPKPLALATPSTVASTAPVASGLAGEWQVGAGSLVRFRVRETVAGSGAHEAVAETSQVTGGLTVAPAAAGYQATAVKVTVALAGLHSVDTLAGRDVTQRDGAVQRALSTSRYPEAVFQAASVSLPVTAASGQPVAVTIPGQLTVHGVTKDVQATAQVQVNGETAQVVGGFDVDMADFGIEPPRAPGISPASATHLEFQADLRRA